MEDSRVISIAELERVRAERGYAVQTHLWAQGSIAGLARPSVAIVGTRAASAHGRRIAHTMAAELGSAGCCIVSGLALGIDAAAHEGALDAGAPTIGVIGSGHEHFFPRRNAFLAKRIIACGGAVLTPFPPEQPPYPSQFLARNGVVAALADAVVVVEAPARSGALNTAHWAASRIPVFAVPGDVDRIHVAGCHALIRDGATLARGAADVLEVLPHTLVQATASASATPARNDVERAVLKALAHGECDFESLAAATHCDAPTLGAALSMLEIDGVVVSSGGRFARADGSLLS